MKTKCSSMVLSQVVHLFIAGLAVLSPTAHAQPSFHIVKPNDSSGAVTGYGTVVIRGAGGSSSNGMMVFAAGGNDISAMLMKACDTSQDGAVTPTELKAAFVTWFHRADTDTNGGLSQLELAVSLKEAFPEPLPPPGFPPPPEEMALHNILAKGMMAVVDDNKDGWVTFKEVIVHAGQNLPRWDADGNGWLDAQECVFAFHQFVQLGAPQGLGFGTSVGGGPEPGTQVGP
jgi:hypothetical protein